MKKVGMIFLQLIVFLLAVLIHMFFWIRYEEYFPVYPEWFVSFLSKTCRATQTYCGQETLHDLYFLSGSIINVTVLTVVIYLIYRFFQIKAKSR